MHYVSAVCVYKKLLNACKKGDLFVFRDITGVLLFYSTIVYRPTADFTRVPLIFGTSNFMFIFFEVRRASSTY